MAPAVLFTWESFLAVLRTAKEKSLDSVEAQLTHWETLLSSSLALRDVEPGLFELILRDSLFLILIVGPEISQNRILELHSNSLTCDFGNLFCSFYSLLFIFSQPQSPSNTHPVPE